MSVYVAKAAGFGLAYYAKKQGWCYKATMKFKVGEMIALLGFEILASALVVM